MSKKIQDQVKSATVWLEGLALDGIPQGDGSLGSFKEIREVLISDLKAYFEADVAEGLNKIYNL
jgi:hypothetical protein